jgi:two-component system nitrate/nitrite response regulator NarL
VSAVHVIICDDHQLFGESLAVVLQERGYAVDAVTTSPDEALHVVREQTPELCIMDLNFPDPTHDGVEAARRVKEESPDTAVVLLTASGDAAAFARAISAGVTGFARKDQDVEGVLDTIERVAEGQVVIDPELLRAAVSVRKRTPSDAERLASFLTPRERQVLELLTLGYTTSRIAKETGVAHSTARTHIQNLLVKLGVHSRLEASAFAVANDLVPIPRSTPSTA